MLHHPLSLQATYISVSHLFSEKVVVLLCASSSYLTPIRRDLLFTVKFHILGTGMFGLMDNSRWSSNALWRYGSNDRLPTLKTSADNSACTRIFRCALLQDIARRAHPLSLSKPWLSCALTCKCVDGCLSNFKGEDQTHQKMTAARCLTQHCPPVLLFSPAFSSPHSCNCILTSLSFCLFA